MTRAIAALGAVIWALVLYFFRDPNRNVAHAPGLVVSAGDGEIVDIRREREDEYLRAEAIRISTFLSITDVHVQRAPISGRVTQVTHRPGRFLQAFRPEASTENEHIAMTIETPQGPVLVKQIAGIMARRCVNYVQPGVCVQTGQRFGLIRFGSRVDLFLPPTAEILVGIGAKVKGGLTPVAHLGSGGSDDTE
ncbi:MAG TPA: phosphatidylserine decarboxylase [Candidatus Sulfomarinibacteraceae bacterium]|nr:phosphatidylserine decarboxylase [Candidatus Sulfomarinibacteraceae bacterium]